MAMSCSKAAAAAASLLLLAGCSEGPGGGKEAPAPAGDGVGTNVDAVLPAVQVEESEEAKSLRQAREFLDSGENARAMNIARSLLDSKDPQILSGLVDIFGWVGKKGMAELEELMARPEPEVSSAALDAWELSVEEISGDFAKAHAITNAAAKLSSTSVIDAVLMHIISLREDYALPALEGLILGERGKVVGECAKSMFEHISGEPYSSPERTKKLVTEKEKENNR